MIVRAPMFIVGIAGGSGSGKTTFSKRVFQGLDPKRALFISQDSYYLPEADQIPKRGNELNFDDPKAFDWDLMKLHLNKLKQGESVEVPVYDYRLNRRTSEVQLQTPKDVLIFEGIYALYDSEVRDFFDLKIFLNVDADIRLIRRISRDVTERGRSLDSVVQQYYDTVRPMHRLYLQPCAQYADLIVGDETHQASQVVAASIRDRLSL